MNHLFSLAIQAIQAHPLTFWMIVFWVFSAAVSAMPTPTDSSGPFYKWAYGFGHAIAGSIARLLPLLLKRFPILAPFMNLVGQANTDTPQQRDDKAQDVVDAKAQSAGKV